MSRSVWTENFRQRSWIFAVPANIALNFCLFRDVSGQTSNPIKMESRPFPFPLFRAFPFGIKNFGVLSFGSSLENCDSNNFLELNLLCINLTSSELNHSSTACNLHFYVSAKEKRRKMKILIWTPTRVPLSFSRDNFCFYRENFIFVSAAFGSVLFLPCCSSLRRAICFRPRKGCKSWFSLKGKVLWRVLQSTISYRLY